MKRFTRADASIRKQQCAKKVEELEQEKKALQKEVEELRQKFANISVTSDGGPQMLEKEYLGKLNTLEGQVLELKQKLDVQSLVVRQKQKSDEAAKRLQDEIWRIKSQKVQLQRKIKQDSVQFRSWKALQEREVLQLKKEGRRTEYEMRKLSALNQSQKLVLQRKTEEAAAAAKWLKELLQSRKASSCTGNGSGPRLQAIEHKIEVTELLNEVRSECEHQMEERVRMAEEAAKFKEEADMQIQNNLWCLLQNKEADCREKDAELKDLKEKVVNLSGLLGQVKTQKAEFIHTENSEGCQSSIILNSGGNNIKLFEDMDISESEHSVMDMANNDWTESGKGSVEERNSQAGGCSSGEGIIASTGKTALGACCSCSKKSLCKTMKCKCRASRGICGTSCGCASTKCTNREAILIKELNNSPQSETANSIGNCSDTAEMWKSGILASHHAMLLQAPAERNDDCGTRTRPLSDIGNIQIKSNAVKPNQRKKWQKLVIQHAAIAPPSSELKITKAPTK